MKFHFNEQLVQRVTSEFLPAAVIRSISPIYTGHINKTFRVTVEDSDTTEEYLLQNLNTHVFTQPQKVMHNIVQCADFLHNECPDYPYEILTPIYSNSRESFLVMEDDLAWRMFEYITDSKSIDKVSTPEEARKIGEAFGLFLAHVNRDDPKNYKVTIPDFHNFTKRYENFQQYLGHREGDIDEQCQFVIDEIDRYAPEYLQMETIEFPVRIIHHDTKVNNVMLDRYTNEPKCIIDLDTLMPGHIFSDLGDLIRTVLNPYEEDSFPENGQLVGNHVISSLLNGFLDPIDQFLTYDEKEYLIRGAKKITLLQVLRFLADHLKGDVYYQVNYTGHNLDRALSQLYLYLNMEENELLNTQSTVTSMK